MIKVLAASAFVITALNALPASAQAADAQCVTDDPTTYKVDCDAAAKLQAALKTGDKQAVVKMINFPVDRDLPLKSIKNAKAFLAHWDEYFDADTTKALTDQNPEQIGWRGIQLAGGMVWLKDGRIIRLNSEAAAYKKALENAKSDETAKLWLAARGYDRIDVQCSTKTLHVRVQNHGDDIRYFAWKAGAPLSAKPAMALSHGKTPSSGSDGSITYAFTNAGYTYEIDNGAGICGETCDKHLTVMKGAKQVSDQVCN